MFGYQEISCDQQETDKHNAPGGEETPMLPIGGADWHAQTSPVLHSRFAWWRVNGFRDDALRVRWHPCSPAARRSDYWWRRLGSHHQALRHVVLKSAIPLCGTSLHRATKASCRHSSSHPASSCQISCLPSEIFRPSSSGKTPYHWDPSGGRFDPPESSRQAGGAPVVGRIGKRRHRKCQKAIEACYEQDFHCDLR